MTEFEPTTLPPLTPAAAIRIMGKYALLLWPQGQYPQPGHSGQLLVPRQLNPDCETEVQENIIPACYIPQVDGPPEQSHSSRFISLPPIFQPLESSSEAINSDLDDSDADTDEEDEDRGRPTGNTIFCHYEKVLPTSAITR